MKARFKSFLIPTATTLFSASIISGGIFLWCTVAGGCTFGKYTGEVTLVNSVTQEPLSDRKVKAYIDHDDYFLISNRPPYEAVTDEYGKVVIEFKKSFNSPLTIITSFEPIPYTQSQFFIQPEKIRSHETVSEMEIERYVTEASKEKDPTDLKLEIDSWSLF